MTCEYCDNGMANRENEDGSKRWQEPCGICVPGDVRSAFFALEKRSEQLTAVYEELATLRADMEQLQRIVQSLRALLNT